MERYDWSRLKISINLIGQLVSGYLRNYIKGGMEAEWKLRSILLLETKLTFLLQNLTKLKQLKNNVSLY